MTDRDSHLLTGGTPEGIFGVFAGPKGPWLFGEPTSPVIPAAWMLPTDWDIIVATGERGGGARVRLNQDDLATPGAAVKKLPRVDIADLAESCVAARASVNPWLEVHLAEAYEDLLPEAETLPLGTLPLLVSTHDHLHRLGYGAGVPLVDVLQLRRQDIVRGRSHAVALLDIEMMLEHWLPLRNTDITWQRMAIATTLTEASWALAARVVATPTASSLKATELIRRRGWGTPKSTLEQLGTERGVTRERMRQIFVAVDKRLGERRWPLSPAVESATLQVLGSTAIDPGEDPSIIGPTEAAWTEGALFDLLECLGHRELATRAREAWSTRIEAPASEVLDRIRKGRSRLGFLDFGILSSDATVIASGHDSLALVKSIYPRTHISGNFILAGTDKATPAERIAGQQFFVTDTMTGSELREGLVRVAKKRSQPLPPPELELVELLAAIGSLESVGGLVSGTPMPLDHGTLQMWLYDTIEAAPGGVIHSEDIVRAAIRDQKNISSLTNYLSYEPIVRRFDEGSGLIRLVGRTVDAADAEIATRIAAAQRQPTSLSISNGLTTIELRLKVGSAFLKNGVLNLNAQAVAIWPRAGASLVCCCGLRFVGARKVHRGGIVTGWQTALVHLVLHHGLQDGSMVIMRLDGGELLISEVAV